ncbi:hypothetical protein C1H46_011940 [Malus baccata]|uniref:Uncharacterized protein n=1 Tax=Malus baccata TaxID=106549 RepID=A0A540MUD8_MALBA|nr:hypothetical protein C1H46_011940 [Malus baccata]
MRVALVAVIHEGRLFHCDFVWDEKSKETEREIREVIVERDVTQVSHLCGQIRKRRDKSTTKVVR